jgi:predicted nucleotidyltransferase
MSAELDLSPIEIAKYRATALSIREQEKADTERLRIKGWQIAREAVRMLRDKFHVSRIVVFGSLVHEGRFTRSSDVDIAAWGIDPEDTFRAIGAVMDLDPDIAINLVDVNTARPSLLKVIEKDGVDL